MGTNNFRRTTDIDTPNTTAPNLADGTPVRFLQGAMPECEGIDFVTVGEPLPDNTGPTTRWFVTIVRAEDTTRTRSRQRRRAAYVDVLTVTA